jgi:Arm DNA-binding domain
MKVKLTPSFVAKPNLPDPPRDRTIYWDQSLPRLGLMVTGTSHKSWLVQYRVRGRSRKVTLDGILSLKEARDEAHDILSRVAKGEDPAAAKERG